MITCPTLSRQFHVGFGIICCRISISSVQILSRTQHIKKKKSYTVIYIPVKKSLLFHWNNSHLDSSIIPQWKFKEFHSHLHMTTKVFFDFFQQKKTRKRFFHLFLENLWHTTVCRSPYSFIWTLALQFVARRLCKSIDLQF